MSADDAPQAPRWSSRSDAPQPFVATVCSAQRLEEAVALVHEEAGELPLLAPHAYASNACSITLECDAPQAWALVTPVLNGLLTLLFLGLGAVVIRAGVTVRRRPSSS